MKRLLRVTALIAVLALLSLPTMAAWAPARPIEFTVVYPAGGGMDTTARILAKHSAKHFGADLVVVNREGGGGLIGHAYLAAQARPDGYTVGVLATTLVSDILLNKAPFKIGDFKAIGYINETPITWVTRADSIYAKMTVKEIFEYAKANPGKINIGVIPNNGFEYTVIGAELNTNAKFTKVPFQGGAPGITALLGGHIDITCAYFSEFQGHLEAGTLKAVAVASEYRDPFLPNTPTFKESGIDVPTIFGAWRFLAVPTKTPDEITTYLENSLSKALRDSELIKAYKAVGIVVGEPYMNAKETQARLLEIYNETAKFYKALGKI